MSTTHAVRSLFVIDPANRTGKIEIPLQFVAETRGKAELLSRNQKDISLCLHFQRGSCNAGVKCNQVHADCEYVALLRKQAASSDSCCAAHGDIHSRELLSVRREVVLTSAAGNRSVPLTAFAATLPLEALCATHPTGVIRISEAKLCRLHSRGCCKFGRDCKNFHACRHLSGKESPAPQAYVAAPRVATPPPRATVSAPLALSDSVSSCDGLSTDSRAASMPSTPESAPRPTVALTTTPTPSCNAIVRPVALTTSALVAACDSKPSVFSPSHSWNGVAPGAPSPSWSPLFYQFDWAMRRISDDIVGTA